MLKLSGRGQKVEAGESKAHSAQRFALKCSAYLPGNSTESLFGR